MRRRTVLRRFGAASATAIGGAGVSAARRSSRLQWQFDDGHVEVLTVAEFQQRSDTPSLADLGGHPADVLECCCCPDAPLTCDLCFICECDDDPFGVE